MSDVQTIDGEWLTYPAAAIRLGKSEPAVRMQQKRDKWLTRKDGRLTEVCVPNAELQATQRQTAVQTPSNDRALALQQDQTTAGVIVSLSAQISDRDQKIGRLDEQLRAARRENRRLQAHVDTLMAALTELRGVWADDED